MRKWMLFIVLVPLLAFAQGGDEMKFDKIPVDESGKVVFADTILTSSDKEKIRNMIYYWVNTAETQERHIEDVKSDYETGTFSCEINDYLYIVRSTWLTFSLYMKYTLSFEYQNNLCIVKLHDINYIEPSEFEKNKNKDMSGAMISGELPLVEKKYKPAFVKDASEKIIDSTLKNVNTLFYSIRKQFDL